VKPRVLLIGGTGQLGTELRRQAAPTWDITAPSRDKLDLARPGEAAAVIGDTKPDLVINASAFHAVDLCESRFSDALAINAVAVSDLAKAAEASGARFVTVSTDYAFDGRKRVPYREIDPAEPVQCYGISKVAGERAALAAHPEGSFAIRSCGLYGIAPSRQKAGNFVVNRLADSRTRESIEIASDLTCTPTSAADLAAAMIELLVTGAPPGLYHLTNAGECDWAAFAAEIYRLASVKTHVVPVDRGGRYAPARRPPYSVLHCGKAADAGVTLRPWQDALAEYISSLAI
jgi:dTDP-4-dehydrorhamnose reductase